MALPFQHSSGSGPVLTRLPAAYGTDNCSRKVWENHLGFH